MTSVVAMFPSCKGARALPPRAGVARRCVSVRAVAPEGSVVKSAPRKMLEATSKFAGACALAVVLSASAVEPAEAAKSGGRAGGSAGFSRARSSQPSAPAPSRQAPAPRVQNNYYGGSPFGFSPFGFSPFGFSPFGYGGAVVVGAPAAAGGFSFFSLLLDIFLVGAFVTLITSIFSGFGKKDDKKKDDDGW